MGRYIVNGGRRLFGTARVQGSKNAALPILAASVLCGGESVIDNCPDISDAANTVDILRTLGARVEVSGGSVTVDAEGDIGSAVPPRLMEAMRSSVIFLGALAARTGEADVVCPGGCELGPRPIDMHIDALKRMGCEITEERGHLRLSARHGLSGCEIELPYPSVGASENIILAAVEAKGETVIKNAAREPEICDLADYLKAAGADIEGAGSGTVYIRGVSSLKGPRHRIMPDRIAAATLLCAAAATGGEIMLKDVRPDDIRSVTGLLERAGCVTDIKENSVRLASCGRLRGAGLVETAPYPGFPTDAQAVLMAALCTAEGESVIRETVFCGRFRHVDALRRMGADIEISGDRATVRGVGRLCGARMRCPDLRAGAALCIAALAADGQSIIEDTYHIDRGYESFAGELAALGADIKEERT